MADEKFDLEKQLNHLVMENSNSVHLERSDQLELRNVHLESFAVINTFHQISAVHFSHFSFQV